MHRSDWKIALEYFNHALAKYEAAGANETTDAAECLRLIGVVNNNEYVNNTPLALENFERGDFGHVLSELAMETCDLAMFDRAVQLTVEPDGLRYAFWRARITGENRRSRS